MKDPSKKLRKKDPKAYRELEEYSLNLYLQHHLVRDNRIRLIDINDSGGGDYCDQVKDYIYG